MSRWKLLLAFCAPLASGCEFVHPPTELPVDEEPVVVHSVLSAGSDRAAVLIVRLGPEEPVLGRTYEYDPGLEPVSGAEVRLISRVDTLLLTEAPAGFPTCFSGYNSAGGARPATDGCYAARVPGGIRSGTRYQLRIRLPDGTQVLGETVPPAQLEVLDPQPGHVFVVPKSQGPLQSGGRLWVRVRAPEDVMGVGLSLRPGAAFKDGKQLMDAKCHIAAPSAVVVPLEQGDSASLPVHGFGCAQGQGSTQRVVAVDSMHAQLFVTGFDRGFMRYQAALSEQAVTPDRASQGITGALGLFAAEATVEGRVTLVAER